MAFNWQDVITTIGASAAVAGFTAWLIRSLVTQGLALQIESFKARLKSDADVEIERLRHSLQMSAVEHQVRFANLQERRAEVIADLYSQIVDLYYDGRHFVTVEARIRDSTKHQEAFTAIGKKFASFYVFVQKNRLYLPERTCEIIDSLIEKVRKHVADVGAYGLMGDYAAAGSILERREAFQAALDAFEVDIPEIRRTLERDFRSLLGVEGTPSVEQ